MTVYLDLVMGLNFAVDLLLILGTNRLAGFPPGILRGTAAAALGGLYAAVCMIPRYSFLGSSLWRVVFLGLMGVIAFGLNKSAWKRTGIFILLAMAMGGIALGMRKTGIPMLLLAAAAVWLLSRIGFGSTVGGREYVPVTIRDGRCSISVIALKDTGNTLRDPITGEQVLVLGPEAAEKLVNLSRDQLRKPLDTMAGGFVRGLRLIPYSTVEQPGGMLLAKRFADVTVGEKRAGLLVAFAPEPIGRGQIYQALAGGCL